MFPRYSIFEETEAFGGDHTAQGRASEWLQKGSRPVCCTPRPTVTPCAPTPPALILGRGSPRSAVGQQKSLEAVPTGSQRRVPVCQALCMGGQGQAGCSAFPVPSLLHGAPMLTSPRNEDLLCSPIAAEGGLFSLTLSVGDGGPGTQPHGLAPTPSFPGPPAEYARGPTNTHTETSSG